LATVQRLIKIKRCLKTFFRTLVETPLDIEHQDAVSHWATEVVKGISHTLHPPAVLTNGEVPLLEGAEGRIELKSAGLGVAKELALEC